MGTFRIKQGAHFHRVPPVSTLPWLGEQSMQRHVTFDESCRYGSVPYHRQDVNKLFGLSFGLLPHRLETVQLAGPSTIGRAYTTHKWVSALHWNSARFGWRWNPTNQCIELLAYVYNNGVRNQDAQMNFPVVLQVKPGEKVWCHIGATFDHESGIPVYEFSAIAPGQRGGSKDVLRPDKLPGYGLTHGLYFGGSLPAPHEMSVTLDRN